MCDIAIILPVYHRDEDTKACIDFFSKMETDGFKVVVCVAINGASNDLMNHILKASSYSKGGINEFKIRVFDKNLGKPEAVNTCAKELIDAYGVEYIISMDSDMVPENKHWLKMMMHTWDSWVTRPEIRLGAICGNQSGNNCHVPLEPKKYDINGRKSITIAKGNNGVAGGVLMTSRVLWESVGGYEAHRLYGSDDGHFCLAMQKNGHQVVIADEIVFHHPFPDDEGYSDWKFRAIRDELSGEEKKGYFEEQGDI